MVHLTVVVYQLHLCFYASKDIKEGYRDLGFSYGGIRPCSKGLQCFWLLKISRSNIYMVKSDYCKHKFLQRGHKSEFFNHGRIHFWWKTWAQLGRRIKSMPEAYKSCKQILQSPTANWSSSWSWFPEEEQEEEETWTWKVACFFNSSIALNFLKSRLKISPNSGAILVTTFTISTWATKWNIIELELEFWTVGKAAKDATRSATRSTMHTWCCSSMICVGARRRSAAQRSSGQRLGHDSLVSMLDRNRLGFWISEWQGREIEQMVMGGFGNSQIRSSPLNICILVFKQMSSDEQLASSPFNCPATESLSTLTFTAAIFAMADQRNPRGGYPGRNTN